MLLNERETLERVLQSVGPPSVENISIWHAGSRVLAQDIIATVALPRFDNSTMDGYAVRAEDAMTGARLLVTGEQAAGPDLALKVRPGEAIRIYTGAPVPGSADAVIMQEDVDADERTILIREGVSSGENIRLRGGDLCEGQKVASKGDLLNGPNLAAIGSQGIIEFLVYKRPRVAILATGSELRSQGEPIDSGEIYETNRILLAQLVAGSGAEGRCSTSCPIWRKRICRAFNERDPMMPSWWRAASPLARKTWSNRHCKSSALNLNFGEWPSNPASRSCSGDSKTP